MKKAVQLKAVLWIEGEDEPRHDFAASSIETVRSLLTNKNAGTPPVTITIKKIEEDNSPDDEGDEDLDDMERDERLKIE